jgi:hypothetical protein
MGIFRKAISVGRVAVGEKLARDAWVYRSLIYSICPFWRSEGRPDSVVLGRGGDRVVVLRLDQMSWGRARLPGSARRESSYLGGKLSLTHTEPSKDERCH